MSANKPINDNKENRGFSGKLKFFAVFLFLGISGVGIFFLANRTYNEVPDETKFTVTVDFNLIDINNEKEVEFSFEGQFVKNQTITLGDVFYSLDSEYLERLESQNGFSWRTDADELIFDSLDKILIENITSDENFTINLTEHANRHWLNIYLGGGQFNEGGFDYYHWLDDKNDRRIIHSVYNQGGYLNILINYATPLNILLNYIYSEHIVGVGIFTDYELFKRGDTNPFDFSEAFYMPDEDVYFDVRWIVDPGTHLRGNAFEGSNAPLSLSLSWNLYADMDEEEMLASVRTTINEFAFNSGRVNIHSDNFVISVSRERIEIESEDGGTIYEYVATIYIDRIVIEDLTFNGTAQEILEGAGFDIESETFFLDMTKEQIEYIIEQQMRSTRRSNFTSNNFIIIITYLHNHNLNIVINRDNFGIDGNNLDGTAVTADLLTPSILQLQSSFFRDMTEIEIRNELNRIMREFNKENARINDTHFNIVDISGMHLDVLNITIDRIELTNITTLGTAFLDTTYNVEVLKGLSLSNLYVDMNEAMIISELELRINNLNPTNSFNFSVNYFTTPEIENYHTLNLSITINRISINPTINGTAVADGRIISSYLEGVMDTLFRDLTQNEVERLLNIAIDLYFDTPANIRSSNLFTVTYLKSDYQTVLLTINRINVIENEIHLHGNAVNLENDTLLHNTNLQITTQLFLDMRLEELRLEIYRRIDGISGPRFNENHFDISLITGAHTNNINITINRVNVTINEDGNAFSDNILSVSGLNLESIIFRDMTEEIIRNTLMAALNDSTNNRINSSFFTIYNVSNYHHETINLTINRNLVTPNVNGTAHTNVLAGVLVLDYIFQDMTLNNIRTLVQNNINQIEGVRFSHNNFETIDITGYHTQNIFITIDRMSVTPNVFGLGFEEIREAENFAVLLTGIYRDMLETDIRDILEVRLRAFNNSRFVYDNFETTVTYIHTNNITVTIARIEVTPTIDYLGEVEILPDNFIALLPRIFKDMTNAMITEAVNRTIDGLTGNHSHITRAMFHVIAQYNHTDDVRITILPRPAGVVLDGTAIDDLIIDRDLLDGIEIYEAYTEEEIREILETALEGLNQDNLIYANFTVSIRGYNTDTITIIINRRYVDSILIDGTAAIARTTIDELNVTSVYWDMLDRCVIERVGVALTGLSQSNLTLDNFNVSVSGNHSNDMIITIDRTILDNVDVLGSAIRDNRFTQNNLDLPTIFRDNTFNEIVSIIEGAINEYTDFDYDFFEISGQLTLVGTQTTGVTITVDRIRIVPTLDGNAISHDLLNTSNLDINTGFYKDMNYDEVYALISTKINSVYGARFNSANFYYSHDTILGYNTLNLTIEIRRILIEDITLILPEAINTLLTVENLNLRTHIFKDMTHSLILSHITNQMNILNADNSRINSQHFTIDNINGIHDNVLVIHISRVLVSIETDGNAFSNDLLTRQNLRLETYIFRDMTNDMIYDYLRDRINDINTLESNARIHYDHFDIRRITTLHAQSITIYISRVAAVITTEGNAFTYGPLTAGLLSLNTLIFRDMTQSMIVDFINETLFSLNSTNARIHSDFFEIIGDITAHGAIINIEIDRVGITVLPSNLRGSAFEHQVLSNIVLSGIYLDMTNQMIIDLVNVAINNLETDTNRINTNNFTLPAIENLHSINLTITVNRIAINHVIAGTAITTYNRFTVEALNVASLETIFFRDMLVSEVIEVIKDAIDDNLDEFFLSEMFNVRENARDINSITIHIDRVVMNASIIGTAITDNRFTEANILSAMDNLNITLYRDTFDDEFERFVQDAINTFTGGNSRFVSSHFDTRYISRDLNKNATTIRINRIVMDIRLDGSAFERLSGDETQQNAHNIGIANFRRELDTLFMDMTDQEVVNEILDALDNVGYTLNRPTFNRHTFFVGFIGRIDAYKAISFTINRSPITNPDIQGGAVGEDSGVDAPWN